MISARSDIRGLEKQLARYGQQELPEVVAETINAVGRATHSRSLRNIRSDMIIRNRFTERSLKYFKASPRRNLNRIDAITGTISPYLPIQEKGGRLRAKRSRVAIPTKSARVAKSKRRAVAPRFRLNRVGETGSGGVFIATSKRGKLGMFVRTKSRVIMIRDLSITSRHIKPTRWHSEAVGKFGRRNVMGAIFIRQARRRIRGRG